MRGGEGPHALCEPSCCPMCNKTPNPRVDEFHVSAFYCCCFAKFISLGASPADPFSAPNAAELGNAQQRVRLLYMVRKSPTPARNSRGRCQFDSGTRESWRRATRQVTRQPGVTIYSVPHPQFQRREKKRGAWTLQQKGCEGLCFPFTPQVCKVKGNLCSLCRVIPFLEMFCKIYYNKRGCAAVVSGQWAEQRDEEFLEIWADKFRCTLIIYASVFFYSFIANFANYRSILSLKHHNIVFFCLKFVEKNNRFTIDSQSFCNNFFAEVSLSWNISLMLTKKQRTKILRWKKNIQNWSVQTEIKFKNV